MKYVSTIVFFVLISSFVFVQQSKITPTEDASYCFMDAVLWRDALDYFYQANYQAVAQIDRPPLSLYLASWLRHFGYSSVESLQLVARLSLAGTFGVLGVGLWRFFSIWVAVIGLFILGMTPSFTKLSIWLNAQMLCNFFFALHMIIGYWILHSNRSKTWQWSLLGLVAAATVCTKEQGLLLLPSSLLFLCFSAPSLLAALRRSSFFLIGASPLLLWYGYWFQLQLQHGEKWHIFSGDLEKLGGTRSLSELLRTQTTWGSFQKSFGHHENYIHFLEESTKILLRDLYSPSFYAFALASSVWIISRLLRKEREASYCSPSWFFWHALLVLPLIVVPIFEPYHYSILMIATIALLGWGLQYLRRISILFLPFILLNVNASTRRWGGSFNQTLNLELQRCISNRIRPVRDWAKNSLSKDAQLYFTDSLVRRDQAYYPQRIFGYTNYSCDSNHYVITSGLSNQQPDFIRDLQQKPKGWTHITQITSLNKELWFVYASNCSEQ